MKTHIYGISLANSILFLYSLPRNVIYYHTVSYLVTCFKVFLEYSAQNIHNQQYIQFYSYLYKKTAWQLFKITYSIFDNMCYDILIIISR